MPFRSALIRSSLLVALTAPAASVLAQTAAENAATLQAELDGIAAQIEVTAERQRQLEAEVAAINQDRNSLNQALVEANGNVRDLERQANEAETRLAGLISEEARLRSSLTERRGVLAEVLAVLQRMGRQPPPAIVVQPDDALAAVRSAILLGAVVPEIRGEAEALVADIEGLIALRAELEAERDRLRTASQQLAEEGERLQLLIGERQEAFEAANRNLETERARAAGLAAQAGTLEELIAALNQPPPAPAPQPLALVEPGAPIPLGPADEIEPAVPFSSLRGRLPVPAVGRLTRGYNVDDGFGGRTEGISIETRASARVAAPADGWVEFAGPYRSYGNLLIINAGGGYSIVLGGMERIDVLPGQFVLAGEPVAAMPATRIAGTGAAGVGTAPPVLYVEFRRDGAAIDPGPWWAEPF